ncbi:MAG: metallophosphoesterase family protein, partial [Candidatus Omnitrophica bacterium]|nr:metallophosphoesterase family protein [Candidatus Omnitrophota bacterium]
SGKEISPVFSDFSGELGYDQITVTHVATTPENMDKIRTLLQQYNRTDIEVITYQQAVKLNDYYKAYYEKMFFEGNEQDFIIASDGAYDPFEYFEEHFSFIDKELLDKRIEGLDLWQKRVEENSFEEYAVIPDVHGDVNALNRVLDDLSKKGVKKFIFLGDYFDRGKNNLEVFERVKQLKEQGNVVCLMGNHDVMFIKAVLYEDFECFERWFYNGGYAFLDNVFGEAIIYEEIDEKSFERIISNEKMQTIAKWLLENLDLYHITDTGVMFIHAGMDINDYFFPGNIEITYDEQFGIKALELMQKDLRLGGVLAKRVISYLDEDYDSIVWVRNRWLTVFDRIGDPSLLVDAVLDQLGVNMIVFGHTVQKDNMPKIIDDRIMGIDLAMSEEMNEGKGTGGFGVFSGKGIFIDNFNFDGTIQDNELLSKEALLAQIKKEKELLKRKLDKEYKVASGYPVRSNVLEGVNATKLSGGHIAFKGTQQEDVNSDKLLSDSTDIVKKVLNNIYPQNASADTDDAQNTKVIAIGIKDISQVKAIADSIDTMEKKKLLQLIRQALWGKVSEMDLGNIKFIFFEDTLKGRAQMFSAAEKATANTRTSTIVFSSDLSIRLQQNVLYYVQIDSNETIVPVTNCAMTGLAILNYFDIVNNKNPQEEDLNKAINLIASGIASIIGAYNQISIAELAKQIIDENGKLLPSGSILLKIRPVDPQYIKEAYERELMVLRSA